MVQEEGFPVPSLAQMKLVPIASKSGAFSNKFAGHNASLARRGSLRSVRKSAFEQDIKQGNRKANLGHALAGAGGLGYGASLVHAAFAPEVGLYHAGRNRTLLGQRGGKAMMSTAKALNRYKLPTAIGGGLLGTAGIIGGNRLYRKGADQAETARLRRAGVVKSDQRALNALTREDNQRQKKYENASLGLAGASATGFAGAGGLVSSARGDFKRAKNIAEQGRQAMMSPPPGTGPRPNPDMLWEKKLRIGQLGRKASTKMRFAGPALGLGAAGMAGSLLTSRKAADVEGRPEIRRRIVAAERAKQ